MAHDVFISYSSKDRTVADTLCERLEARGIRCWMAPRDIGYGSDWGESIVDAIGASRVMVLVFSASANESPHIKREVDRAVTKNVAIVPIRIEDVRPTRALEYYISPVHWMDALVPPLEPHIDSLAERLHGLLGSTETPASLPAASPPAATIPATPHVAPPASPRRWRTSLIIGGAVAAAVVGAAVWTQPWASRPATTVTSLPDPGELRREVAERLADHGYSLRVDVRPDRTVTLSGTAESSARRDEALRVARAVRGVANVVANIGIREEPARPPDVPRARPEPPPQVVAPAFDARAAQTEIQQRLRERGLVLDVHVSRDAVATLTGIVHTQEERSAATRLAQVDGVRDVRAHINVKQQWKMQ